ncbi:MAG: IS4 family transposase [bacterium]
MNIGRPVFAQLMSVLPKHEFRKCVARYRGNYKVKTFSCWDQFLCMAFAQVTFRESLRDIETCLRVMQEKLYHMGIRGKVARNTLAHANERRDWRICADFAHQLIYRARELYSKEPFGVELKQTVYAFDSSTIDLCLSLFPWAKFRKRKGAVKLHTLIDLHGNIPTFIKITDGKVHDVNILDELIAEPGSIYLLDRGYLDFGRLYALTQRLSFFVIRAKKNLQCRRLYSHPVDKATGLRCDQTIKLTGYNTAKDYPSTLRRVRYFDTEKKKRFTFLTNLFSVPAIVIPDLYRCRWQVELFFKWIKQHLRIKTFYGTSENAVKTQIWIAVSVYVLVAIVKKQLHLEHSLYTILQILSVAVFEKRPILQVFSEPRYTNEDIASSNQLTLFDL